MSESAQLVLASRSPRRADLLRQLGMSIRICPADISETLNSTLSLADAIEELARRKAEAVRDPDTAGLPVLGADTLVVLGGSVLGKPADPEQAADYLRRLSGSRHEVLTGVAVAGGGKVLSCLHCTRVHFRALQEEEIQRYVASGEPMGKAGAYGIQGLGGVFVDRIEGSYTGVMGLPVAETASLLRHFGIRIP